jgi:hypothetical protein
MWSRLRSIARLIPAVVVLAALAPAPAVGQIGGALNKAKKKATETAVPGTSEEKGCTAPKFDKDVLELTADRIDRVMKGVQATRTEAGPDGKTAAQKTDQANAAFEERDKLMAGKEEQAARYSDAESAWEGCRSEVLDSLNRQHGPAAQQRLMQMTAAQDAAAMQAVVDAQTAATTAAAQGDTMGYKKHMTAYWKALGVDHAKDTAAADRQCKKPVKPAWLSRADSLGLLGNKLVEDARGLEEKAAAKGAETAGMGERQLAIARERITAFLQADGAPSASWCFSPAEREALKARLKDLKAMNFQ